jgi:hypothetical protein
VLDWRSRIDTERSGSAPSTDWRKLAGPRKNTDGGVGVRVGMSFAAKSSPPGPSLTEPHKTARLMARPSTNPIDLTDVPTTSKTWWNVANWEEVGRQFGA